VNRRIVPQLVGHVARSFLMLAAVNSCRSGEAASARDGVVAIGVGAIPGRPGYEGLTRGVELAVERLNEQSGTTFRTRLPGSKSTSAVQIAQQLRDDQNVLAVVGHPESGNTLEVLPIYEDAQHAGRNAVVAVSPTASSPQLTGISPWFFRVAPSDDDAARYVADWVVDSLKAIRAAIIYRNDSYGRDWSTTFAKQFVSRGAAIAIRDPYLADITEWEAYAQHIAEMKPDVILFPGDAPDALEFQRALRFAGVTVPFIGGDGTEAMRDDPDSRGARLVAFYRVDKATTNEARTFVQRYRKKYNTDPDMFAALSYDAALAIGRAVQSGARTRPAVREALERFGRNGTPALEGAGGSIAFNTKHDVVGRTVVVAFAREDEN
jgi:branched-chain amino acid transport system substrate-binding protein